MSRIYWSDGWVDDGEDPGTRVTKMYMDESEVIEAANALELDRLLPVHYDLWKGAEGDPKALHDHAASFRYPGVVVVGRVVDRFDSGRTAGGRWACLTGTTERPSSDATTCDNILHTMDIGFFAAHEEYSPTTLLGHVERAADAGFDTVWTSDHIHPW